MGWGWDDVENAANGITGGKGGGDMLRGGMALSTLGGSELYNELSGGRLYGDKSTIGYGLNSLTNPNVPNPSDAAMPFLDRIPGQLKEILGPYMQQGRDAYGQLNPAYSAMTKDPGAYLDNIMKGYQPSRAYQLQKDEMLKSAGNTAAAGGMRGTGSDVMGQAKLTDSLMGDDMQKWLQNVMGVQARGLQGLGNFYDSGFNASQGYGSDLSNVMGTQAQLAFQGQANQNQADADKRNMWIKLGGAILGPAIGAGIGKWG